ncbi:hypothetical protein J4403_03170 [Candidatus Woesearchaeota archaeon]|nr:hypothetical protein [Candidatus Woesearchaeota archaeon]
MPKIHTREKRKYKTNKLRPRRFLKRKPFTQPKAFRTEEQAHTWAKKLKLKNYILENIGTDKVKKIKIRRHRK